MAENDTQIVESFDLPDFEGAAGGSIEERMQALELYVSQLARASSILRSILHFQNFSANPTKCSIGDVAVVGGKLKVCTAANTWTIVGTQT